MYANDAILVKEMQYHCLAPVLYYLALGNVVLIPGKALQAVQNFKAPYIKKYHFSHYSIMESSIRYIEVVTRDVTKTKKK